MVNAEVIEIEELPDKNIYVWVCFTDRNGVEIPFWRGSELLIRSGHKVWPLICRIENFMTMSDQEKTTWIDRNIEHQFTNVIPLCAKASANADCVSDLKRLVIGRKYSKDSMEVSVGINGTGDRLVILKDDGTYVERAE